jgi:hypothetical protein
MLAVFAVMMGGVAVAWLGAVRFVPEYVIWVGVLIMIFGLLDMAAIGSGWPHL